MRANLLRVEDHSSEMRRTDQRVVELQRRSRFGKDQANAEWRGEVFNFDGASRATAAKRMGSLLRTVA